VLSIFAESTPLFLTGVFVFGLLIGSFLNVVILRVPARLEHEWRCQCRELLGQDNPPDEEAPADIVHGRSRCPQCGHGIRAYENIPVISFVALGGKCSSCKQKIPWRYPIYELSTAILFVATAWHFGPTAQGLSAIVLTGFLIALTGIDLDHQLLPDNLTLPLLWIGLFLSYWAVFVDSSTSIFGAISGYLSLWLIYHLFRFLTGKEGMGYGDFKLMGALGAWMGWQMLPLVLLLSSVVGALVGLTLMGLRGHKASQPIPFGPFIAAAGWIAMLWGDQILNFYLLSSGLG
jgi:leader peptidase (prepilin peptidase)/N-methyltransferase